MATQAADHWAHHDKITFGMAAQATVHCLMGCEFGESIGLSISVSLGLKPVAITMLAVLSADFSGFTFATYNPDKKTWHRCQIYIQSHLGR